MQALTELRKKIRETDLSLACKTLCGHDLRRFHWTCLFCRTRRVHVGELPDKMEVQLYYFTVRRNPPRRFAAVRDLLIKRLLNVLEALAA